jgi:hypothetical protein
MGHGFGASESDIEREFTSLKKPHFIVHFFQGFYRARGDDFNVVKNFIHTRSRMPDLKDRLHTIWFDGLFG